MSAPKDYVRDYRRDAVSSVAFDAEGMRDHEDSKYYEHIASGILVDRDILHTWTQSQFYDWIDSILYSELETEPVAGPLVLAHCINMARSALSH